MGELELIGQEENNTGVIRPFENGIDTFEARESEDAKVLLSPTFHIDGLGNVQVELVKEIVGEPVGKNKIGYFLGPDGIIQIRPLRELINSYHSTNIKVDREGDPKQIRCTVLGKGSVPLFGLINEDGLAYVFNPDPTLIEEDLGYELFVDVNDNNLGDMAVTLANTQGGENQQ